MLKEAQEMQEEIANKFKINIQEIIGKPKITTNDDIYSIYDFVLSHQNLGDLEPDREFLEKFHNFTYMDNFN